MSLVIAGATIIDAVSEAPLCDHSIWIEDGRIKALGVPATLGAPPDVKTIDATGRFVIPGLMNANVHLLWEHPHSAVGGLAGGGRLCSVRGEQGNVSNVSLHEASVLRAAGRRRRPRNSQKSFTNSIPCRCRSHLDDRPLQSVTADARHKPLICLGEEISAK
jgi:hypothetical protein